MATLKNLLNFPSIPQKPNNAWSGFYLDCFLAGKVINPETGKNYKIFKTFKECYDTFIWLKENYPKIDCNGIQMTATGFDLRRENIIRKTPEALTTDGLACYVYGPPVFCLKGRKALEYRLDEEETWATEDWDYLKILKEKKYKEPWADDVIFHNCKLYWTNGTRIEYCELEGVDKMNEIMMGDDIDQDDIKEFNKLISEAACNTPLEYVFVKDVKTKQNIGQMSYLDVIYDCNDGLERIMYY